MARDREVKCIHYQCEGSCALGHDGIFQKTCQHCKQYRAFRGSMPRRKDNRRQKKEKMRRQDERQQRKEYFC